MALFVFKATGNYAVEVKIVRAKDPEEALKIAGSMIDGDYFTKLEMQEIFDFSEWATEPKQLFHIRHIE